MTSDQQVWERGWDGHEREQRRRLASLPLAEKLQWLEEADELVRYLRSSQGWETRIGRAGHSRE
jgi:squalene cyclase